MTGTPSDWRESGVRIMRQGEFDANTPQTPGMHREAAISRASAGAEKIWAGTVIIEPGAQTGAHHHGALESVIYVVAGRAVCGGATGWSSLPRRAPATSFTSRLSCRTRKSTPMPGSS